MREPEEKRKGEKYRKENLLGLSGMLRTCRDHQGVTNGRCSVVDLVCERNRKRRRYRARSGAETTIRNTAVVHSGKIDRKSNVSELVKNSIIIALSARSF